MHDHAGDDSGHHHQTQGDEREGAVGRRLSRFAQLDERHDQSERSESGYDDVAPGARTWCGDDAT
jgi:hypothetical protein